MHKPSHERAAMLKIFLFVFLPVTLVAFVACGSDSNGPEVEGDRPAATPPGTPTAAEQAYLDDVEGIEMLIGEKFAVFGELMGRVYATRSALFDALEEAGAGTAFDAGLAAMEALEPPERFRDEHALALDGLREFQRVDREIGQAVTDNDLVAFALASGKLGKVGAEQPLQHSSTFCLARFNAPHLCERPDFSSSGEYGEQLYSIFSRLETDVGPAIGAGQLPALTEEEILEVINAVGLNALDVLEQSEEAVRALDPPDGLEADHDRLVRYLGDLLEAATEWQRAAGRGDFAASREQTLRLQEVSCTAAEELLSSAIFPFVLVHFGGMGPCGVE